MSTVLIVDDDNDFATTLAIGLRGQGFDVIRRIDGRAGAGAVRTDHPDVVLLDLGLPELAGMDVLHHVRSWSGVPVIVVSARDTEVDKIAALEAGADDYVTKPFAIGELAARIRAALRRSVRADGVQVIAVGEVRIDLAARSVTRSGATVALTPTEWRVLDTLLAADGAVVEHADLLRTAWGPDATASTEYLRVYTAALRRKLEATPSQPKLLLTVPGTGYRFAREA